MLDSLSGLSATHLSFGSRISAMVDADFKHSPLVQGIYLIVILVPAVLI